MRNESAQRTGRGVKLMLAAATLIALIFTGWLFLSGGKEEILPFSGKVEPRVDVAVSKPPAPQTETASKHLPESPFPGAIPPPPVPGREIVSETVIRDKDAAAVQETRKAPYRLRESVDAILPPEKSASAGGGTAPMREDRVIVYETLKRDKEAAAVQETRKTRYGLRDSVDMIVRSEESISVGGTTVPMQEILDAVRIREGELVEKSLTSERAPFSETDASSGVKRFPISIDRSRSAGEISEYGIYVVQRGDNIWNIHFKLLKEHFAAKGIRLPPTADKPGPRGISSGIGRILKFSEKEVYIYNSLERRLSTDIGMIFPLSKIIVYNMKRITSLLDQIDPLHFGNLRFDGATLWVMVQGN